MPPRDYGSEFAHFALDDNFFPNRLVSKRMFQQALGSI
jgi:hypothetical protein